jgi:hypothetical protein
MAIDFRCVCGHQLSFEDSRAGERGRCPRCMAVFTVPIDSSSTGDGDFVSCPSCGKQGKVPPSFRGRVITCKHCRTNFTAPTVVPIPGQPSSPTTRAGLPPSDPALASPTTELGAPPDPGINLSLPALSSLRRVHSGSRFRVVLVSTLSALALAAIISLLAVATGRLELADRPGGGAGLRLPKINLNGLTPLQRTFRTSRRLSGGNLILRKDLRDIFIAVCGTFSQWAVSYLNDADSLRGEGGVVR